MQNLQNLHEMIRNLSAYIKSLEVVCENGVKLAKNFEYLLSPGPTAQSGGANLDSDVLTQSVATWELAHKVATADANALITELLPLLQEAVQLAMKDPSHSNNSHEVFRSCFSAFFQIQWRFCSIYLQCSSLGPARSPTTTSFSSSGDRRRESTESCMTEDSMRGSFSLPRSSISGLSALSSRSSSPSPQISHHHTHHYGHHHSRSRNSSPSVKFTPSQPPSPLYGDGSYPYLFRRWSAHTHNYNNSTSMSSGPSASSNLSGAGSCGSSGSCAGGGALSTGLGFSRRWSVPASSGTHNQQAGSTTNSTNRKGNGTVDAAYDYGLLDAINLLSTKPSSPIPVKILPPAEEESIDDFYTLDQTSITSLWPPSETMPGVVLTTCGSDTEMLSVENLQRSSHQSLRVPFSGGDTPSVNSIITPSGQQSGEYSLFGNSPSPTQGT